MFESVEATERLLFYCLVLLRNIYCYFALSTTDATRLRMNPPCARCYKPVYPVEKLSILDKFWHKGCFRCTSCNSSLTLKSFKGFNKQPYCPAHIPKPEHSTIADDPESVRLRHQQQIVSNVEYHKEFQEKKGHYTPVADDPESLRLRQQQQIVSNVEYHKEFQEKIRGQYTPVANDPESMRIKKNTELQSQASYRTDPSSHNYTPVADDPETMRLKKNSEIQSNAKYRGVASNENNPAFREQENTTNDSFMSKYGNHINTNSKLGGSNSSLNNQNQFTKTTSQSQVVTNGNGANQQPSWSALNQNQRSSVMNALDSQAKQQVLMQEQQRRMQIEQQQRQIEEQQRQEADKRRKDDLELQKQQNFERQQAEIMEKQRLERLEQEKRRRAEEESQKRQVAEQARIRQLQEDEHRRRIEEEQRMQRAAEYEAEQLRIEAEEKLRLNGSHNDSSYNYNQGVHMGAGNQVLNKQPPIINQNGGDLSSVGAAYRAEYDYTPDPNDPEAADELMFEEGDVIVDLVKIDEGWSTGTNQRTGRHGMLPSNYIVQIR